MRDCGAQCDAMLVLGREQDTPRWNPCLLAGDEQKCSAQDQIDAIDLERISRHLHPVEVRSTTTVPDLCRRPRNNTEPDKPDVNIEKQS